MEFGVSKSLVLLLQVVVLVDVSFSLPVVPLPVLPPSPAPAHPPNQHHHHHGPAHSPVKPPAHPPVKPPAHPPVKPPAHPPVKPPAHPPVKPPAHPPVKPPAHPPVKPPAHPPVKPPAYPPTPSPLNPPVKPPTPPAQRSFIAVQGVVYCESCKYSGKDSLIGAKPISGAVVKLACYNSKYKVVQNATTDKNGYFFMTAPKTITNYAFHKCKVFPVYSPLPYCKKPAKLNGGLTGAPLKPYKPLLINKLPFTLYSVGPFAFEPKCLRFTPHPHV